MKILKKVIFGMLALMMIMMLMMVIMFWNDTKDPYQLTIDENSIPQFESVETGLTHAYNSTKSHALTATALIDVDNDGTDEIFVGNGFEADDHIIKYEPGGFVDITAATGFPAKGGATSYGALTADFDNNGYEDLVVGREDGLHLYSNSDGKFTHSKIQAKFNDITNPAGLTCGDINNDGYLDIYAAGYVNMDATEGLNIFRDGYGASSRLFLNKGDNTFKDITKSSGIEDIHNTFQGVFVDLDNDGGLDLVVAQDTGEPVTFRNNKDNTFTKMTNPLTGNHLYPMGIAVGDYNNDGLTDIFFTNSGSSMPTFIVRGDLESEQLFTPKWTLFENKGGFKFENVADKAKVADYEFAWGATFADLNNDSRQDLLACENWADFPPHKLFTLPGRVLIQNDNQEFVASGAKSGASNPAFGISPLVFDFDNDGDLDLFWSNVDGPSKAFLNKGIGNNFLKVRLPQNAKNIGSKVNVFLSNGKMVTEDLVVGEGLCSDQSSTLNFGLGKTRVERVVINYPSGEKDTIVAPRINSMVSVVTDFVESEF